MELLNGLPKEIKEIIERYVFKSMHVDSMKRNYVFEDIKGYRRLSDGIEFVNSEGKTHREGDKPAVIYSDGYKAWYKEGTRHRDGDKPAVIWLSGTKEWYKEDLLHRDGDEPAIIWSYGSKLWYKEGKEHREHGPAIIRSDGREEYWVNGERIK